MLNTVKSIFGTKNTRDLKKLNPLVQEINGLEEKMKQMSDEELKAQTPKFRKMLEDEQLDNDPVL